MKPSEGSHRLSRDALLLVTLSGSYIALQPIIPLPRLVPFQRAWTFLLLLEVGAYCLLDLRPNLAGLSQRANTLAKWTLVFGVITANVLAPLALTIFSRRATEPYMFVHDGLLQSELAVNFVLEGKNPYVEDYFGTPMESWPFQEGDLKINPALQHYPYLPLTFLLPLPVQAVMQKSVGWFDQRIVYLFFFLGVMMLGAILATDPSRRLFLTHILGLNPLFAVFLIEGRNDVLPLFWILLTVALLQRGRLRLSALALALACATKQFAWFFVPFYMVYACGSGSWRDRRRRLTPPLVVFGFVSAAIVLPWLLWDSGAFLEDILGFQSGITPGAYPVAGMGLSAALNAIGGLGSAVETYPFWVLQAAVGLPLMAFLLRKLWVRSNLSQALSSYAFALAAILFVSRAFHDNYIGYLVSIVAVASLMDEPRNPKGD